MKKFNSFSVFLKYKITIIKKKKKKKKKRSILHQFISSPFITDIKYYIIYL